MAPFPPEPVEKEFAVSVSPAAGIREVLVTRSLFREPMTVIRAIIDFGSFGVGAERLGIEVVQTKLIFLDWGLRFNSLLCKENANVKQLPNR